MIFPSKAMIPSFERSLNNNLYLQYFCSIYFSSLLMHLIAKLFLSTSVLLQVVVPMDACLAALCTWFLQLDIC
jgi:hypothetical protein